MTVRDHAKIKAEQRAQVGEMLMVVYALTGLAIAIAVLSVVNTLTLAMLERTREVGLLRAVGMSRRQIRLLVRSESVVITVYGTLLGLALGLGWGIANQRMTQRLDVLVIPWGTIAIVVATAAAVGCSRGTCRPEGPHGCRCWRRCPPIDRTGRSPGPLGGRATATGGRCTAGASGRGSRDDRRGPGRVRRRGGTVGIDVTTLGLLPWKVWPVQGRTAMAMGSWSGRESPPLTARVARVSNPRGSRDAGAGSSGGAVRGRGLRAVIPPTDIAVCRRRD
ncbi:ABC transporter permease [Embleya sp. NPDC020630]|uniref:ABC transporter permease n=1 Tax=Embleya sp. NPDC020630 TaxID=3363979 RepID=UPI003791F81F